MLEDRSYMRADPHRSRWSATVVIIIAVTVCFALQEIAGFYFHKRAWTAEYLGLSTDGLRSGFIWQLITFQFLHGGWVHLLLNCWGIFVFGPPLEATLGKFWLARLYLLSGVVGGALQVFASMLSYERFGGCLWPGCGVYVFVS